MLRQTREQPRNLRLARPRTDGDLTVIRTRPLTNRGKHRTRPLRQPHGRKIHASTLGKTHRLDRHHGLGKHRQLGHRTLELPRGGLTAR